MDLEVSSKHITATVSSIAFAASERFFSSVRPFVSPQMFFFGEKPVAISALLLLLLTFRTHCWAVRTAASLLEEDAMDRNWQ
jgi:hypothetical protein